MASFAGHIIIYFGNRAYVVSEMLTIIYSQICLLLWPIAKLRPLKCRLLPVSNMEIFVYICMLSWFYEFKLHDGVDDLCSYYGIVTLVLWPGVGDQIAAYRLHLFELLVYVSRSCVSASVEWNFHSISIFFLGMKFRSWIEVWSPSELPR